MVTDLEMKQFKEIPKASDKTSYRVNASEMKQFETERELSFKIGDKKEEFQKAHGLKSYPAYDKLEEICQINSTSIRQTVSGRNKVTRRFLYKFTIGLRMTLDEANEYFALCGGRLNLENKEDYICAKALEDGDSIYDFIEQFEKYTDLKIALR